MFARVVHARRSHDGLKGKLKGKGVLFTVHHLKMKKESLLVCLSLSLSLTSQECVTVRSACVWKINCEKR